MSPRAPQTPRSTGWAAVYGGLLAMAGGCGPTDTTPRPTGIVVLSLDTLRADRIGAWGHPGGLTPNLDRLALQSIRFSNAHAQANETLLSHASLWTSRYASELGPFSQEGLPQGTPTLAGRLHGAGWQTGAAVAGGHLAHGFGLGSGFDAYDDSANWGSLTDTTPTALRWLDGRDPTRPFFLFVHGYDTHDRYLKPTPLGYSRAERDHAGIARDLGRVPGAVPRVVDGVFVGASGQLEQWSIERIRLQRGSGMSTEPGTVPLTPADRAHLGGLYDGSVAWMDAAVGRFMGELESRDLLDHVWIIVLSDHGHELGEHGAFHHRLALTDTTLHVPLLIRPPGGLDAPEEVDALVELIDVAPTVLQIAGAPPDDTARGQLLWSDGAVQRPDRDHTFSEGRLRLLSARSASGSRLTAEGLSADHPELVHWLETTPIGGPAYTAVGPPQDRASVQRALVDWRRRLQPGQTP